VRYVGIEGLALRDDGSLVVDPGTGWAPIVDHAPIIYQEINRRRLEIPGRFVLGDEMTCAFEITGDYDREGELVIDPELDWSSYLGGSDSDSGDAIAVDGSGNILVSGRTSSSGWVSGGFDTTFNGGTWDAFVAKVSPQGVHLWSTYLGGSEMDHGYGIAVDGSSNIVLTGLTESSGWVSGGFDTTLDGWDVFVAKLSPQGAHLWSTYLGGNASEFGYGIAVDGSGNIVVTGETWSSGWVSGGFDTTHNGFYDAFVAKLSPQGAHVWSSYLGGSYYDYGYGITVDGSGNIVVTGRTESSGWVSGGFDTTYNGDRDAFVAKIRDGLTTARGNLWQLYE